MPSKKATALFIILLILLFLTGYSFSKRFREKREQSAPTSQSFAYQDVTFASNLTDTDVVL